MHLKCNFNLIIVNLRTYYWSDSSYGSYLTEFHMYIFNVSFGDISLMRQTPGIYTRYNRI